MDLQRRDDARVEVVCLGRLGVEDVDRIPDVGMALFSYGLWSYGLNSYGLGRLGVKDVDGAPNVVIALCSYGLCRYGSM